MLSVVMILRALAPTAGAIMSDRDHIDPLALAVLDDYRVRTDREWRQAGEPYLTPRASAVLRAVEEAVGFDGGVYGNCCECSAESCSGCSLASAHFDRIRRAWRES